MKIPYGISNFGSLRSEGYFYVDKTPFLPAIEQLGPRYLLFLRPRRIGKSLFLSLLEHYYDLGKAERFDDLFRGLWIHEHPTPERNRYPILRFDFSQVAVDGPPAALRRSFFLAVMGAIRRFLAAYAPRFPELRSLKLAEERLDAEQDGEGLLTELLGVMGGIERELYVLVDEYDNFANRLLSDGSQEVYESAVTRTGFVRTFYATLKAGTGSGAVGRMFITGVAPLLLDDLSSGFNIAAHISSSPASMRWPASPTRRSRGSWTPSSRPTRGSRAGPGSRTGAGCSRCSS